MSTTELANIPTPKANFFRHVQNLTEASIYFSISLATSLATAYIRQLEVFLGCAFIVAIIYSILTFDGNRKATFFRLFAMSLGLVIGLKELLILFWVKSLIIGVILIGVALLGFKAYQYFQGLLEVRTDG